MKRILLLIASIATVYGCTNSAKPAGDSIVEKSKTHKTIKIDLKQEPVMLDETGLVEPDGLEILHLDCEEVFDRINRIIRYKNRIYILDNWQTNSVYIFDDKGKHINTISRQGQGPEDYAQLMGIDVDTKNSTLNLTSRMDKKLLKFDLDGKRCLGVEQTAIPFKRLLKVKDGYIGDVENSIWDKNNPYNVWQVSEKQELKKGLFEIDPTWSSKGIGPGSAFSTFKDKLYYVANMDFNIYSIKNGKVLIEYTFDLGDDAWPSNLKEWREPNEIFDISHNKVRRFYYFQETDKWLIAYFIYQGQMRYIVYDKKNDKAHFAKSNVNFGDYFLPGYPSTVGIDETAIYFKMDASNMKTSWVGKTKYVDFMPEHGEQIERLRKKFPVVDEEGNPYLLIYSIK